MTYRANSTGHHSLDLAQIMIAGQLLEAHHLQYQRESMEIYVALSQVDGLSNYPTVVGCKLSPVEEAGYNHAGNRIISGPYRHSCTWKTAVDQRKVVPIFDEAGLVEENRKAFAVAKAMAKGAILSTAKPEALAYTIFGINDVVDIIVDFLIEDCLLKVPAGEFERSLFWVTCEGVLTGRILSVDLRQPMVRDDCRHACYLHADGMSIVPLVPMESTRSAMAELLPFLQAHIREYTDENVVKTRLLPGHGRGPRTSMALRGYKGDFREKIRQLKQALDELERASTDAHLQSIRKIFIQPDSDDTDSD